MQTLAIKIDYMQYSHSSFSRIYISYYNFMPATTVLVFPGHTKQRGASHFRATKLECCVSTQDILMFLLLNVTRISSITIFLFP
jgi:hypothetical protein